LDNEDGPHCPNDRSWNGKLVSLPRLRCVFFLCRTEVAFATSHFMCAAPGLAVSALALCVSSLLLTCSVSFPVTDFPSAVACLSLRLPPCTLLMPVARATHPTKGRATAPLPTCPHLQECPTMWRRPLRQRVERRPC
jgi:hypothetical protein